jgi:hypothetical protein
LGSIPPALASRSHWATEHGGPPHLTQASPTRPELRRHSSGIYVVFSPNTGTDIPHTCLLFEVHLNFLANGHTFIPHLEEDNLPLALGFQMFSILFSLRIGVTLFSRQSVQLTRVTA